MTKQFKKLSVLLISAVIFISACSSSPKLSNNTPGAVQQNTTANQEQDRTNDDTKNGDAKGTPDRPEPTPTPVQQINLQDVKPNEAGKIMVVMFHNFIESYKSGDKEYTTTFDAFRKLLPELYEKGYRLISVKDFINNNINVPAGCIPMVFTFDDGTKGQFNLVKENGKLVANKQSAIGIMEEFNKTHPDFGLKGTFYVNLGLQTFEGEGTLEERLKYLTDMGFEIGNHTFTHINLKETKSAEKIIKEVGENNKKMAELVDGFSMETLALPYGNASKELQAHVVKGEYQGMKYENLALMEVGWDPSVSPISKKFNPLSTHRVRASGISPIDADLAWWLKNLSRSEQFVSDGSPDTITVPGNKQENVDPSKLNGKKLITY